MKIGGRTCLVCDCEGTMPLDGRALARALGSGVEPVVHHQLCRREIDGARTVAATGEALLIACTQEAPLFAETLAATDDLSFVNIRERAGWSAEGGQATPKMAALLAEAAVAVAPATALTLRSEGRCLIIGSDDVALDAARQLAPRLDVTLLVTGHGQIAPPQSMDFPIFGGSIAAAVGHLGAFLVTVHEMGAASVSSRDRLRFQSGQEAGRLEAHLIVDLTGAQSLFAAPAKRDGYLRADPRDPAAVQRALFEAAGLVGEFEKPRYVALDAAICAHSRSGRTGCTRCLDLCPTGAIVPAGDHVAIDPYVCAGCGSCAAICPTGAVSYAAPTANALLERLRVLLGTYLAAGGGAPVLLVHEERHGGELISAMARFGRGLPARALPFAVSEIAQLGLEFLTAAVAYGAETVLVLAPPAKRHEIAGVETTVGYTRAVLDGLGYGAARLEVVEEADPDRLEATLYDLPRRAPVEPGAFLPLGGKRALMRAALDHLHRTAPTPVELVPLPEGAPFGTVELDVNGCTLCLACVGACPTGALLDNPEQPMLRFLEDACVQCGLCRSTCPEKVIKLQPRLSFAAGARSPRILKEEEPALCLRCGKAFGTRSTIDRIVARLAGRNPLFATPEQVDRIRMCDDCRVISQFEVKDSPMALGKRPRPRASEDYLRERLRSGKDPDQG